MKQISVFLLMASGILSASCNQPNKQSNNTYFQIDTSRLNMVLIPAGEFIMGTDNLNSLPNERPSHAVQLKGFWIDKYAVTNAEFRTFVETTGYITTAERPVNWEELKKQLPSGTPKPDDSALQPGALVFTAPAQQVDLKDMSGWWTWTPGANWKHPQGPGSTIDGKSHYPVVQVSWDDAKAYADWAGKRLPTEAEWEYASWGGAQGSRYYWGNELKQEGKFMANTFTGVFPFNNTMEDGFEGLAPVGSFPANGYGLYDMAGNVWNWTADAYNEKDHAEKAAINCQAVANQADCCQTDKAAAIVASAVAATEVRRVTKGGSFLCNPSYCESYRPTARRGTPYDTGMGHIGFRCVLSE